jgi:serine/threonine protein kinase
MHATRIGPFALVERLGEGGMGDVWLARPLGVPGAPPLCVLKVARATSIIDPMAQKRFEDESRVALLLRHPSVCRVVDAGRAGDTRYLAFEVVEGIDLHRLRTRAPTIDVDSALWIAATALDGLAYAHNAVHPLSKKPLHVVHRDVSPHNIMVSADGNASVIDFGLALSALKESETAHGLVMGKLGYMSPEQARGETLDGKSDVYTLAVSIYETLAGESFFGGLPAEEIWRIADRGDHVPSGWRRLEKPVRDVLASMLQGKKSKRANAAEGRDAVVALLRKRGVDDASSKVADLIEELAAPELFRIRLARSMAISAPLVDEHTTEPIASVASSESSSIELLFASEEPIPLTIKKKPR